MTQYSQPDISSASSDLIGRLVDESNDAIFVIDPVSSRFIAVNNTACVRLGYERDELLKMKVIDIETELADAFSWDEYVESLKQTGQSILEGEHKRKDGSRFSVEVSLNYSSSEQGDHICAIVRDTSGRKQVERELQRSQTRFKTLFDSSSDAIMIFDLDGFVDANKSTLRLFGYTSLQEFVNKHPAELSPPLQSCGSDSRILANTYIQTAIRQGSHHFEWLHQRVDGVVFPADVLLTSFELDGEQLIQATVRDITSLKRADSLFRTLFDVSPLSIQIIDANGITEQVNDSWCRMWGAELQDVADYNMLQDEQLQEKGVLPYLMRAFAGEALSLPSICYDASQNGKINSSHASVCWVESWAYPIHGVGGEVQRVVLVHQDVTARKQQELFERDQRHLLELVANSQTTLSTVLEATVQAVERQCPGMLGSILLLDDDGKHLSHGAAPGLPEAYCQAIDGVAIGPCVGSCGTAAFTGRRVIVSDINSDPLWGDYKELALSYGLAACWSEPIRNAEGKVLGTFAMYYQQPKSPESADIQLIERAAALAANGIAHKQAEEQLRLLHDAVASVNESVMITDSEGIIFYANQAFTDMFGYSQEEVLGCTPAILNSRQQSGKFYLHYWQTIKAGKPWSGRLLDRRKDGTIFPVHMSVAPIFDAHDVITHFVAIHEDLSEYELFQKKLAQSQKMEAVGVMAGGIAHDFNNLLAGLTGNLYMMRMHNTLNEELVQRAGNMEVAIMHGAKMIQQLLTFARKDHMEMHDFDLSSFFKETHKLAAASLPENVRLTLKYDAGGTWVHGDPTQLQQLILNLVTNARHAVKDSANPVIHLDLSHTMPPKELLDEHAELISDTGWCCMRCTDNGCGISDGNLEHIFEPFFTTREVGVGTGLGLAMSYGAVQSHRGMMDVQSVVGAGTTFAIYLPLRPASKSEVVSCEDCSIDGENRGVLVVDDNEHLREVIVNVLRYNGFTVWQAADGELALSEYRKYHEQINLILMDIVMPNMGGVAAAKEIRNMNEQTPIIFLTGYGEETQLQAASSIKRSSSLGKPLGMADLIKVIDEMMGT